ncbi:MAG: ATP-dependent Clp protease proteolytic subunit [Alistipes sp.]|nr:ATP-dependent Clp protease proteolytic subunit [Alistipes sp.]MBQ9962910.1 ATP-dependent Clp protease proteolytic subunit [Alistipes sp.]
MENIIKINIDNSAGVATIDIEGTIGMPNFTESDKVATYEEFKSKIVEVKSANPRKVVVNIRSTGGDVNDALLIYDALKEVSNAETICYGYTASAATIIAQAAAQGKRKMSANGLYLIHRASTSVEGNAGEFEAKIDLLRKTDERIAAIYAEASGRPAEEFVALMGENNGNGKWLNAEEALAAGLIDEITSKTKITNEFNPEEQGLPALPQNHLQMAEKTTVLDRMLAWFEKTEQTEIENKIAEKEAEVATLTAERDAAVANIATLKAQLADKEAEVQNITAQLEEAKAMAVKASNPTQQVQDPDPQVGATKTPNQLAYEADVASFKR